VRSVLDRPASTAPRAREGIKLPRAREGIKLPRAREGIKLPRAREGIKLPRRHLYWWPRRTPCRRFRPRRRRLGERLDQPPPPFRTARAWRPSPFRSPADHEPREGRSERPTVFFTQGLCDAESPDAEARPGNVRKSAQRRARGDLRAFLQLYPSCRKPNGPMDRVGMFYTRAVAVNHMKKKNS